MLGREASYLQDSPLLDGTNIMETLTQEQKQRTHDRRRRPAGPHYKWVALTNTTMGSFMATLDASIVLIAFPAIFKGIGINPLAPGETSYFLWLLLGYMVVTASPICLVGCACITSVFSSSPLAVPSFH